MSSSQSWIIGLMRAAEILHSTYGFGRMSRKDTNWYIGLNLKGQSNIKLIHSKKLYFFSFTLYILYE
jgi:hypothetical protein